jgi:excisionase family DNA binding protein
MLGVSEKTIGRMVNRGELPRVQTATRRFLMPVQAIEGWVTTHTHYNTADVESAGRKGERSCRIDTNAASTGRRLTQT